MSRIYLLRHGESEENAAKVFSGRRGNPALTPVGKLQAAAQGLALIDQGVTHIFSSPLLRARQTSETVGETLGIQASVSERLLEVDLGQLDGRGWPDEEPWEQYEAVRRAWEAGREDTELPGGESLSQVQERLRPLLFEEAAEPDACHVLVGHGVLFMSLLWLFCENRAPTLQGNYMRGAHLTKLRREDERLMIEAFDIPPP